MSQKKRQIIERDELHRVRWDNINWPIFLGLAGLHVGCLLAPFYFTWGAFSVALFLWWLTGGIGICLGFHRLLTHRGFQTFKPIEYAITVFGTMSLQGSPIHWVGTHRMHHRDSDREGDPHSPKHGFDWSHMLWCVTSDPFGREPRDLAKEMQSDPVHRWLDRYYWAPLVGLAAVLYVIGGMPWLVWGVFVRTVFSYHATWFVNSAGHTWGYRNFDTREYSTNNWWVALLAFGEGWHNNHHAFSRSARHGLRWWEIDMTWYTIRLMEKLHLVWNVHVADPWGEERKSA